MSQDLTETIAEKAQTPAEVRTEEASVKARPLSELIEADKYLKKTQAAKQPTLALRVTTLDPPGTT